MTYTYLFTVMSGDDLVYWATAEGDRGRVTFDWTDSVAFPDDAVVRVHGPHGTYEFQEADRPMAVTAGMVTSVDWDVTG